MTEPVAFISHFRIKEGKLEAYRQLQRDVGSQMQEALPRTLVFLIFLSEDQRRMTAIHVFADAESMDRHFEDAEERASRAYEVLEPLGWEVYGRPSGSAMEVLRRAASGAGVPLTVEPEFTAGWLRLAPGGLAR